MPLTRAVISVGIGLCAAAVAGVGPVAVPAGATTPTPESIVLAGTASCTWGDVDITYAANGATRRSVSFTAADGAVLYQVEGKSLGPDFSGTEHVLAEATQARSPGTLLGVHVTVGTTPPAADTTAEFFVLYRCSPEGNDKGGTNTVVQECHGPFGTCPPTAAAAVASPAPSTTAPPPGEQRDSTTAPAGAGGGGSTGRPGTGPPGSSPASGAPPDNSSGSAAPGSGSRGATGATGAGEAPGGSASGAPAAAPSTSAPLVLLVGLLLSLALVATVAGVAVRRRRAAGRGG